MEGFEADDVIATLTTRAEAAGLRRADRHRRPRRAPVGHRPRHGAVPAQGRLRADPVHPGGGRGAVRAHPGAVPGLTPRCAATRRTTCPVSPGSARRPPPSGSGSSGRFDDLVERVDEVKGKVGQTLPRAPRRGAAEPPAHRAGPRRDAARRAGGPGAPRRTTAGRPSAYVGRLWSSAHRELPGAGCCRRTRPTRSSESSGGRSSRRRHGAGPGELAAHGCSGTRRCRLGMATVRRLGRWVTRRSARSPWPRRTATAAYFDPPADEARRGGPSRAWLADPAPPKVRARRQAARCGRWPSTAGASPASPPRPRSPPTWCKPGRRSFDLDVLSRRVPAARAGTGHRGDDGAAAPFGDPDDRAGKAQQLMCAGPRRARSGSAFESGCGEVGRGRAARGHRTAASPPLCPVWSGTASRPTASG